jgi:quinol monooxygenase YgiN
MLPPNSEYMTTEVIRYNIPSDQVSTFEEAYRKAEPILQNSNHCLGYRLLRGVEEPDNWILLLIWDSVAGHEKGFREEKGVRAFFGLVKLFLGQVQEMKHYDLTHLDWSRAS